jgi:hypothetical protein
MGSAATVAEVRRWVAVLALRKADVRRRLVMTFDNGDKVTNAAVLADPMTARYTPAASLEAEGATRITILLLHHEAVSITFMEDKGLNQTRVVLISFCKKNSHFNEG